MAHSTLTLLLRRAKTNEQFELSAKKPTLIGNSPDCTIAVSARLRLKKLPELLRIAAPRIQAVVVYRKDSFCLIDQSSCNRNRLNGETIRRGQPYPLKEGDRLSLAGDKFIVEDIHDEPEEYRYPNTRNVAPMVVYGPPELFFENEENENLPLPVYGPPPLDFDEDDKD